MKKRIVALIGMTMMSAMLLFTGCGDIGRSVSVGSDQKKSEDNDSKKVTKGSSEDDEEETTKKKSSKKSDTSDDDEEETTKKKTKDDEEETTKKRSSGKSDEEETTKKKSDDTDIYIPEGWSKVSGDGYSYYIDKSAWTETSIAGSNSAYTHLGTAVNNFTENINVMIQDTKAYQLDLEGYKDLSLQQYDQIGYELVGIDELRINGVDGYYVVTSTEQMGMECYVAQWFTLLDDKAYIFTFAADEEDFGGLEDEVLDIYGTVVFE